MKLGPVLHDLKRGVLRIPVLMLLALFALGGAGAAYLTYSSTATTLFQGILLAYFTIDPSVQELSGVGILIDRSMRDVRGTLSYEMVCSVAGNETWSVEGSIMVEGSFTVEASLRDLPQWVGEPPCDMRFDLTTPYGSYPWNTRVFRGEGGILWAMVGIGAGSTSFLGPGEFMKGMSLASFKKDGSVVIHGVLANPSGSEAEIYVKEVLGFELPYMEPRDGESAPTREELEKIGYRMVGVVGEGLFTVEFDLLNESARTLDVVLLVKEEAGAAVGHAMLPIMPTMAEFRQTIILSSMYLVFGTFSQLFPIMALYLAYIYIARPRAWGALEFVLARPISRFDLFLTRYAAGVLMLIASTLLFAGVTQLSMHAIFSTTLDAYAMGLILVGTALSLIAFYGLCYFLSTVVKGGMYLALSILSYLTFTLIINIAITIAAFTLGRPVGNILMYYRLSAASWLFNPLGASNIAWFYIQKDYSIGLGLMQDYVQVVEEILQPWAVAASIASWIAVPVVAGWMKFRRANLSQ